MSSRVLPMSGPVRKLMPTDAWVRFALVPALAFIAMASDGAYLADFWHHLARGRAIVAEGSLLDHDIFTFTVPGQPFQDVNWLTQVLYFVLYDAGGLGLVQVANAAMVAMTMALLVAICRRRCGSLVIAMTVGIATFLGLWHVLTLRPQTFSLLLFLVTYDVIDRSEERPWLLAAVPFIMALWTNLHGAFPAGLMLLGSALAEAGWRGWRESDWRRFLALTACVAASSLATFANPYGLGIYSYVAETSSRAAARRIDEWVPPSLDIWIGRAFFASILVLAVLTLMCWRRRLPVSNLTRLRDWLLLAMFLPLALGSARMVTWWLLLTAPVMAQLITTLWPARDNEATASEPNRGAGLVFAGLLAVIVSSVPGLHGYNPLLAGRSQQRIEHDLDVALAKVRELAPSARIFTRLEWGEYLGWAGSPRYLVFMDGRIEIYPDEVWREYATITTGQDGWQAILDRYQVDALVLDADYHRRTGLLSAMEQSTAWRQACTMRGTLVFARRDPGQE